MNDRFSFSFNSNCFDLLSILKSSNEDEQLYSFHSRKYRNFRRIAPNSAETLFPQNFHTSKHGEILIFYAVFITYCSRAAFALHFPLAVNFHDAAISLRKEIKHVINVIRSKFLRNAIHSVKSFQIRSFFWSVSGHFSRSDF